MRDAARRAARWARTGESHHHQGFGRLGEGLVEAARAEDGAHRGGRGQLRGRGALAPRGDGALFRALVEEASVYAEGADAVATQVVEADHGRDLAGDAGAEDLHIDTRPRRGAPRQANTRTRSSARRCT